ncbi:MAG: protein phosphatase 2C domain-containing protein, partial [Desulfobacula sp.]|nr:protein phosphatase 2C domain-containing protein [Desulfobacula sp.]
IRGKKHAHQGKFREDIFEFDCEAGFKIMAVADGAGSFSLSRVGGDIAVKKSVEFVKSYLCSLSQILGAELACVDSSTIEDCLEQAGIKAIKAIKCEAEKRNTDPKQFSTTLILAVAWLTGSGQKVSALQVGDGLIVMSKSRCPVTIIGEQDRGRYISQSKFLTSQGIVSTLRSRIVTIPVEGQGIIAIMTDGIADDIYPPRKDLENFSKSMNQILINEENPMAVVKKWIRYEKKGSYDDRTIIVYCFK